MYFIYLSFFTFGSPVIIYFILAFFLENSNYFKPFYTRKRPSVWDIDWAAENLHFFYLQLQSYQSVINEAMRIISRG